MIRLMGFLGATIGSYAGWLLAARYGFMTAFMTSMVGTGVGLYVGRRAANAMLD